MSFTWGQGRPLRSSPGPHLDSGPVLDTVSPTISWSLLNPECKKAAVKAGGEGVMIDEAIADMPGRDAQKLELSTHVGQARSRATQTIPPATRREVLLRDQGACTVPPRAQQLGPAIHD
jgi:hypothetical protein